MRESGIIPGTEPWDGWADYGFYRRGFLKGAVGITVASVILAGTVALIGL